MYKEMYIDPASSIKMWGIFRAGGACIKLTRNTELHLSSVCKLCEHTTLQHIALTPAEKIQAEGCFLTTAGWKN